MKRRGFLTAGFVSLAAPALARQKMHGMPREMWFSPFLDSKGQRRALCDFEGQVVLFNIWASWHAPSREELPRLDALQARLGDRDFRVLPLSIDEYGVPFIRRIYSQIRIRHLDIFLDEGFRTMRALGVVEMPTTLLIDRGGRELGRYVGPVDWNSPANIARLKPLVSHTKG